VAEDFSEERIQWARMVLQLPRRTTRNRIIRAYRERAKELHPDAGETGDASAMAELNEAYQILLAFCDEYPIELGRHKNAPLRPEDVMRRFDGYWFPDGRK